MARDILLISIGIAIPLFLKIIENMTTIIKEKMTYDQQRKDRIAENLTARMIDGKFCSPMYADGVADTMNKIRDKLK